MTQKNINRSKNPLVSSSDVGSCTVVRLYSYQRVIQLLCRGFFLALIVMGLFAGPLYSQEGQWLRVVSSEPIPFDYNEKVKLSDDVSSEQILTVLKQDAWRNAYLAFSIDTVLLKGDTLLANVHLGDKYLVDEYVVQVAGNDSLETAQSKLRLGRMKLDQLPQAQRGLLSWYENHGYPFASISLDRLEKNGSQSTAHFLLKKGSPYAIDSIIIKSEQSISLRNVCNRIGISVGDIYDESALNRIEGYLNETGYLTLMKSPEVLFSKDKAVLYLFLKKKSSNIINGLVGFLPNDKGDIEFTGNLDLQLTNAMGADESFKFGWRKLQNRSQDLKIKFSYPYVFRLKMGLEQDLSIYRHDTTYTEVKTRTGLQYLFTRNKFVRVFIQSNTYNSLVDSVNGAVSLESSIVQYGVGGQWSSLDYRYNPRKGWDSQFNIALGDKKITGNYENSNPEGSTKQIGVDGYLKYYIPIAKRSVVKLGADFAHIENDLIIENELFRLGGVRSIRGFDEESFSASSYVVNGMEYRYLTDLNSYFSAFVDYALFQKKTITSPQKVKGNAVGVGLGVAFETKAGIFSLSYALGSFDQAPFLIKSGKIHFGFNAIF